MPIGADLLRTAAAFAGGNLLHGSNTVLRRAAASALQRVRHRKPQAKYFAGFQRNSVAACARPSLAAEKTPKSSSSHAMTGATRRRNLGGGGGGGSSGGSLGGHMQLYKIPSKNLAAFGGGIGFS